MRFLYLVMNIPLHSSLNGEIVKEIQFQLVILFPIDFSRMSLFFKNFDRDSRSVVDRNLPAKFIDIVVRLAKNIVFKDLVNNPPPL